MIGRAKQIAQKASSTAGYVPVTSTFREEIQQMQLIAGCRIGLEPIREPLTPAPLPLRRGEGTEFSDRF
jgi:hypothetical protein